MNAVLVLVKGAAAQADLSYGLMHCFRIAGGQQLLHLQRFNHRFRQNILAYQIVVLFHERPLLRDVCFRIVDIITEIRQSGNAFYPALY
ncbi:hypothetical protein D3C81_823530 [compost metagenome]